MQVDITTALDDATSHDHETEMKITKQEPIKDELEKAKGCLNDDELELLTALVSSTTTNNRTALVLKFAEEKKRQTETRENQETRTSTATEATAGKNPGTGTNESSDASNAGKKQKFMDFFRIVLDYAIEKWGEENIWFNLNQRYASPENAPRDDMIKWADNQSDKLENIYNLSVTDRITRKLLLFESDKFTKTDADHIFEKGITIGDLRKLQNFCEERLIPLRDFGEQSDLVHPELKYVDYEGETEAFESDPNAQMDKSYAVVVAGESGSGKSVLSCLLSKAFKYLPVYVLLALRNPNPEDSQDVEKKSAMNVSDIMQMKPQSEFPALHEMLRSQLNCRDRSTNDGAVEALCAIKAKLNVNRNKWAKEVLEAAVNNSVKGDSNARDWIEGSWNKDRLPKKVAIILDEATDIDLVEGLVESVKQIYSEWTDKLATNRLLLVLTGTGLDAIRYPGRVGTSPKFAKLIKVKGPANLDILKDSVGNEIVQAADRGLYSRVMKTNTRMLFRSVIPILKLSIFHVDAKFDDDEPHTKKQRLEERLSEVANVRVVMDHGPRFYVTQNSVGDLGSKLRGFLLKDAFLYHLITAIKKGLQNGVPSSFVPIGKKSMSYFEDIRESNILLEESRREKHAKSQGENNTSKSIEVDKDEIFERGLATREGTSPALKYLSSFGLSCRLRFGWGDEFEELTALHYMRLMEVQGYTTARIELKYSWPPQSRKSDRNISEKEIERLKKKLKDQMEGELSNFEMSSLENEKHCTVFSPGTPSAQGSDVLVLKKTGERYELESFQCKHKDPVNVIEWWWSLGIKKTVDGWDFSPKTGSAGHSYAGLEAFRQLLKEKISKDVSLGTRTMAVSRPMAKAGKNFPCPDSENADIRVWFREMFQPTISVFPPAEK
mmetsp:Transcript_32268/g.78737  ORF Transcript_32268/g.78737 Transcript_32268/m.78737 type:complete len:893 (-) Transcript_32268:143-2821(-)